MDLGGAPQWVLKAHSSDQLAHLLGDPRSATGRTRLPSPVSGKTHAMPTQDGLGPNDGDGAKDARSSGTRAEWWTDRDAGLLPEMTRLPGSESGACFAGSHVRSRSR